MAALARWFLFCGWLGSRGCYSSTFLSLKVNACCLESQSRVTTERFKAVGALLF